MSIDTDVGETGTKTGLFLLDKQYPWGVYLSPRNNIPPMGIMNMKDESRDKLRSRVNRAAGQIAGIGRMIDENAYCVDILTQIAAVRSALDSIGVELLTDHLESCVIGQGGEAAHECAKPLSREELVEEVRTVVRRFLK